MATLQGLMRLGRDAEVRYLQDGNAVANLSLAYNYGKKDRDGNRETTWVTAALWGKRAENSAQYLTKGTQLSVILSDVHVETYEKRDGGTGFTVKANVVDFEFAGGNARREDGGGTQPRQAREPAPAGAQDATERTYDKAARTGTTKPAGGGKFDDFEDDIPF